MASHALGQFILWAIVGVTLAICLLAWLRGGPAERWGAAMVAVAWSLVAALESLIGEGGPSLWLISVPLLSIDFVLSFGLLVLALRYGSLWVGVAMLAQGAQLGLHALFIAQGGHHRLNFAIGSNISSGVLLTALLAGTLVSWRRRLQVRAANAETISHVPGRTIEGAASSDREAF